MNCQHFGICGGCSLPGVEYAEQLLQKQARLTRLLGMPVPPLVPSPREDRFRTKVAFVFGPEGQGRGLVMGHYARGSKQIVRIHECPVHSDRGNRIAFALRDRLVRARIYGAGAQRNGLVKHIIVRTTDDDRQAVAMLVVTRNDKALRTPIRGLLASADRPDGFFININDRPGPYMLGSETIKIDGHSHVKQDGIVDTSFLVSPTAFFQTNIGAAREIAKLVIAGVGDAKHVLDLYTGSGLLSLPLVKAGVRVTAVEENRQAMKDAEANIRLNRIAGGMMRLVTASVEEALPRVARDPWDAVVLDPPRQGCPPEVLDGVFNGIAPPRAVYVSCNPEALAAELPVILSAGYRVASIQPVDMFPHTDHIETVVTLTRGMNPFTNSAVNQITKGVVIVSTLAAAFVQLYLATRLIYPQLFFIVTAVFIAALVAGIRWKGAASGVVMAVSYLAPALYVIWPGFENYGFEIVWSLPLLGLILSGRDSWRWQLPAEWRWPLVTWALVVAASWPFVFLRELDFYIGILPLPGVANTSIGITPWDAVTAVTYWTLVHNIGLLWFDRLFGWFAGDEARFRKAVVVPLMIAMTVACAVGAYQAFVDLHFVNPHLWPHMRRASGTLGDAGTFGMLAALWAPAAVVLARQWRAPWSAIASIAAVTLGLTGVLTSGSRTGLAAIGIGLAVVCFEVFRTWRLQGGATPSARRTFSVVAGIVALSLVVLMVTQGSSITGVVGRGVLGYLPGVGDLSIRETAYDLLWDRNTYGPAAVLMIKEHPVSGVGVGAFHTLVHDYGMAASNIPIVPDNAQSWYRHHLAELGGIGSLPWMAWCLVFAGFLFSRAKDDADRFGIGVLRGCLIAFGLTSLLGVPGQSLPVALTFWSLVFWIALLKRPAPGTSAAWSKTVWGGTLAVVVLLAAVTYADARGDLRPRNRSMRFGWEYRYGLGTLERDAAGQPERRTSFDHRSLSVGQVKGRVMKFAAWINHPDGDEKPVHVRVWADSRLVYDGELKRSSAILQDIPATPGRTHMVIESEISRLWQPRDYGRNDRRVLGLSIRDWVWE